MMGGGGGGGGGQGRLESVPWVCLVIWDLRLRHTDSSVVWVCLGHLGLRTVWVTPGNYETLIADSQ